MTRHASSVLSRGISRHAFIDDNGKRGSGQSAPHETQQGANTPGHRASEAAGNVADSHCTPTDHRGAEPSSSTFSRCLASREPGTILRATPGGWWVRLDGDVAETWFAAADVAVLA